MTVESSTSKALKTVFDAILASLAKASDYNRNDMVAPAVVLWTDKDRQWEPLADRVNDIRLTNSEKQAARKELSLS